MPVIPVARLARNTTPPIGVDYYYVSFGVCSPVAMIQIGDSPFLRLFFFSAYIGVRSSSFVSANNNGGKATVTQTLPSIHKIGEV